MNKKLILGLGNLYVETNYLGVETAGSDILNVGKEYSAPVYEIRLGGSAVNFITQINKFGLESGVIGKCGDDGVAETLFKLLKAEGVKTDLIKKTKGLMTNVDTGFVLAHSAQNIQVVAGNANQSLSIDDIDLASPILDNTQAVYFGGCFKQKNLWPHYPKIFKNLHSRGIQLFIDPGRVPVDADSKWIGILKEILPYTSAYLPNDMEVMSVTGKDTVESAINEAINWGAKLVVAKLGANGCMLKTKNDIFNIPGYKVKAVNTVGAGDCFNASFISALYMGKDLKGSGEFANAAAAFRVSKNYQPTLDEIEKFKNESN